MITNLLKKVLVYSTIGTVIGFSTILGAANSAAALIVESESTNNKGVIQDISHIVFYMKDNSGDITKVKIDGVSGTTSYDATNFLKTEYPDSQVLAYQVKASTFKSLNFVLDGYSSQDLPNLDKNGADKTYQYSQVSNLPDPGLNQTNSNTSHNQQSNTQAGEPTYLGSQESSTNKVTVPEPGTTAAIAIFALGGFTGISTFKGNKKQQV